MKRNQPKGYLIIIGVLLFVSASIYVPWEYTVQKSGISQVTEPAGYHLLFQPPPPESDYALYGVQIDLTRLLLQYLIIFILISGFWLLGNIEKTHAAISDK